MRLISWGYGGNVTNRDKLLAISNISADVFILVNHFCAIHIQIIYGDYDNNLSYEYDIRQFAHKLKPLESNHRKQGF